MLGFGLAYLAAGLAFLALDVVWLSTMGSRVYRPLLAHLLRADFALSPALLFYLLYVVGIVVFAVQPAIEAGRWASAAGAGLLLGLIAYGTYDLTNHATLKDWPLAVTVIDMAWGAFATGVAAIAGYFAVSRCLLR
jgi:uncharacterized membrane protein